MTESKGRYVFLVRHASRSLDWRSQEKDHVMLRWGETPDAGEDPFETRGYPFTLAMAGRLGDELDRLDLVVTNVLHSNHTIARQTAEAFVQVLDVRQRLSLPGGPVACDELTPPGETKDFPALAQAIEEELGEGEGWLVVGHQPQLTQLARRLGHLPGGSLPLGSSEVACLGLHAKPGVRWLLTAKSGDLLTDLRDKIKSKYDVAKLFLGALIVGTGLTLNPDIWANPFPYRLLAGLGLVAALMSLGFTAATLLAYDSLLMPTAFWQGGGGRTGRRWSVARPPSQAQVVLFYEMMHVWTVFFIPALVLAFAALGLHALALALPEVLGPDPSWVWLGLSIAGVAVIAFGVPALLHARFGPDFGVED